MDYDDIEVTPMSSSRQKKKTHYLGGDYSNLADLAEKVDWFTVSFGLWDNGCYWFGAVL